MPRSSERTLRGKLAAVTRLVNQHGADKVVVRVKGKTRRPNAYARFVRSFSKSHKGLKGPRLMKSAAKAWNRKSSNK